MTTLAERARRNRSIVTEIERYRERETRARLIRAARLVLARDYAAPAGAELLREALELADGEPESGDPRKWLN